MNSEVFWSCVGALMFVGTLRICTVFVLTIISQAIQQAKEGDK